MIYRTDLAVENVQYNGQDVQGYLIQEEVHPPCKMELVEICSEEASRQFGKPIGKYATVSFPPFSDSISRSEPGIGLISQCLTEMLPQKGCVLVMGLGNRGLTADALGPKAADRILATRHIQRELARVAGIDDLRSVAVCSPGVLGETGMETAEILVSLVKEIQPQAVIAIDALAAADIHRMGCTVQITDAGIAPGDWNWSANGGGRPNNGRSIIGERTTSGARDSTDGYRQRNRSSGKPCGRSGCKSGKSKPVSRIGRIPDPGTYRVKSQQKTTAEFLLWFLHKRKK